MWRKYLIKPVFMTNPYESLISLIVPTKTFDYFQNMYNSLVKNLSDKKLSSSVEILIKIDESSMFEHFDSFLKNGIFKYKILIYPRHESRLSLHLFFNDLCRLSSGQILWILNDDALLLHGDWFNILIKTLNTVYKDNIYYVGIPMDNGKGAKQIVSTPAISKQWLQYFNCLSPFPNFDRWLYELSKKINRQILINENDMLMRLPVGRRVLSKIERKSFFYPELETVAKKFLQ